MAKISVYVGALGVILVLSTNAFAKWVEIDPSAEREFSMFFDPASIKKNGDIYQISILKNYKSPQNSVEGEAPKKILSAISIQEINCTRNVYRNLKIDRWSGLNASGILEFSYDYSNKNEWSKWVRSTSLEGAVIAEVCRKK